MSYTSDFDEAINDFNKIMRKLLGLGDSENVISNGEFKGRWDVQTIYEPNVKGFSFRRQFSPEKPFFPQPNPFEPTPLRRPTPKRPFIPTRNMPGRGYDTLVDVFEGEFDVRIYVELPSEGKDGIQLSVVDGGVEIKARDFYKIVKVPENIDVEKASSKHKNRVLEVTIPKKREISQSSPQRISIE